MQFSVLLPPVYHIKNGFRVERYRPWLYLAALLLLLPALLINLGLLTFIDDEAIRCLVALEMELSGNYVTPTLNGEFYYKKPPLFNWILLAFFELTGRIDEFTARSVTVLALLGYAATVFYFFRRHYSTKVAFLNAFILITCGRILFWDSMLALIDITFSWVVFTSFMIIYHEFEKGRFWRLFLLSYLLAAIAFLLKGLPAVVFQGITLVVYFAYRKYFRGLFSLPHIAGGALFVLIVGSYYFTYHQYNSLEVLFNTLVYESTQRTVVHYSWWETILHIFTFPFEMVYHFLPWSLFIIYFIRRDIRQLLRRDSFILFNLVIFLANILVYWTSPEVYPRYLLMLAPLIFSTFVYLHFIHRKENTWQFRTLDRLLFILIVIIAGAGFAPLFLERSAWIIGRVPKAISLGAASLFLVFLYQRWRSERLLIIVLFLLVFRIGFDWFVLPDRNANDFGNLCRISSKKVGNQFIGEPLYIYGERTLMQMTNSFYITNERRQIVPIKKDNFVKEAVYIIDPPAYPGVEFEKLEELYLRHGQLTFHVGRLK